MKHIYLIDYLKDKAGVLVLNISGLFLLVLYLSCLRLNNAALCMITLTWLLVLFIFYTISYIHLKKKVALIYELLEKLEKKYLLGELMPKSENLYEVIYRDLIRKSNRSVIEAIHALEKEHESYREYIECWIHEVKTPITAISLICENDKNETTRKIQAELTKIDDQVENVLYYARSNQVYEDYLIHEVDLKQVVLHAIAHYKQYFIQSGMQVELDMDECIIPTDDKWLSYLLHQVFKNAIQYRRAESPLLKIYMKTHEQSVSLVIEDNGIGILQSELGRIFEKGFTGSNGRKADKSTGIGLYLCKKMCDELKLGLVAESKENEYTRIIITFPFSQHQRILQK